MTDPVPPAWEGDPLSTFLSDAQRNERVSTLKLPDVYALLQRVHAVFQQVATITEKEHNANLLPTRFLMARAHAAWLERREKEEGSQPFEGLRRDRQLLPLDVRTLWSARVVDQGPLPW